MSRPERNATRSQLRTWLKGVVGSGRLDMLPTHGDLGPGDRRAVGLYARRLLAELQAPDADARPLARLLADVQAFRAWVEARQRACRRLIMAQPRAEEGRSAAGRPRPIKTPPPSAGADDPVRRDSDRPEADPLWDRWLDG